MADANCPACGRYIGRAAVCPYCDVDIPLPPRLRLIRITALIIVFGGLLLLWLATTRMAPAAGRRAASLLPDLPFPFYTVLRPHFHWMLWGGIAFMLLAEPSQPVSAGKAGWRRCLAANRPSGMAALVFVLSGLLGFILFNAAAFTPGLACLGLIPAAGIATLPQLYVHISGIHTLGIILLPLACELSGLTPALATFLHLP